MNCNKFLRSRLMLLLMGLVFAFALAGCGQEEAAKETAKPAAQAQETAAKPQGKTLVVYFSVPETTKPDNMNEEEENSTVVIDGRVLGNTQYVAEVIREKTGAEIFRIEPETPYPMNHAELEKVATKEKQDKALPKISGKIENLADYDTIFVGYPNWYADMPRIMYSFFEDYDLSGKTVILFVTSGGSGFSDSIRTIKKLEPNAKVMDKGLSVSRDKAQESKDDILSWLKGLGY